MNTAQPPGDSHPLDRDAPVAGEANVPPYVWPLHDEAELNKDRLALALEAAGLDLWENDLVTGAVTRQATKTFAELGYAPEEMAAQMLDLYGLFHPDDVETVRQAVHDHLSGVSPQYRCEFRLRSKQGEWVWFANYGRIMDTHTNTPGRRLIGVTFNIHDRKQREQEIAQINQQLREQNALLQQLNGALEGLASRDALTGLSNRRSLMELGHNECLRAYRYGYAISVLVVDIDRFKDINDSWGHLVGDRVICAVAHQCQSRKRAGVDIVARFGGEEFVIVLPQTDNSAAMRVAEALRAEVADIRVSAQNEGEMQDIRVTVSIGVASAVGGVGGGVDGRAVFEALVDRADQALYKAKGMGRNTVCGGGAAPALSAPG